MAMNFIRRLSTDAGEGGNPPLAALRGSALRSSLSEGTSKIFSSVVAKTNGLKQDLTSKVDSVFGDRDDERQEVLESLKDRKEQTSDSSRLNGSVRQNGDARDTTRSDTRDMHSRYGRDSPRDSGYSDSRTHSNFDMYRRESKESIAEKKDPMEKENLHKAEIHQYKAEKCDIEKEEEPLDERNPDDPPFRVRRHSIVDDPDHEEPYRRESIADDFGFTTPDDSEIADTAAEEFLAAEAEDVVDGDPVDVTERRGEMRKIIHAMSDLISFDEDAFDRHSQSSNSEYGDGEPAVYERSESACSDRSSDSTCSSDSLLDEFTGECKQFMRIFVSMIFKKE